MSAGDVLVLGKKEPVSPASPADVVIESSERLYLFPWLWWWLRWLWIIMVKGRNNGPEEMTYIKQGAGWHIYFAQVTVFECAVHLNSDSCKADNTMHSLHQTRPIKILIPKSWKWLCNSKCHWKRAHEPDNNVTYMLWGILLAIYTF